MYNDLVEALQLMIESSLSDLNTSVPGKVVSYDATRNRAVVAPSFPKALSSDDTLEAPKIVEVPVVWPTTGSGKASFTMPLQPGDGVMLSFQQRSLEGWLSGNEAAPKDPRQFDLSDCVAHPGLNQKDTVGHDKNVVLKFNKSNLVIDPDNNITLGNDQATITIQSDGGIIIKANYLRMQNPSNSGYINIDAGGAMTMHASTVAVQTPANSYVLEMHNHIGVQPGPGNTGKPI